MGLRALRLLALAAVLGACGSPGGATAPEPDADGGSDGPPAVDTSHGCPAGQARVEDECRAVGPTGCAALFVDPADGICKPSMDACPKGTIPSFEEGCVAVGVQGCVDMFVDPETGVCATGLEDCAAGKIPKRDQGCVPVGIPDCHPMFVDGETGLCDPDPYLCLPWSIAIPQEGCYSLDPPGGCGSGAWGDVIPLPGDQFVDPSHQGPSNGGQTQPWKTIQEGVGHAAPGGRVLLAAGAYPETVILSKSIAVVGRCSSMVAITGAPTGQAGKAVVQVAGGAQVSLMDLAITGEGPGLLVYGGAQAFTERVAIVEAREHGVFVVDQQSEVLLQHTLVASTRTSAGLIWGRGVDVENGAKLVVTNSAIIDNRSTGIYLSGTGTSAHVSRSVVAGTTADDTGKSGQGLEAANGAQATVVQSAFVHNEVSGIVAHGSMSRAEVYASLVAHTRPHADGQLGRGIEILEGAAGYLEDSAVMDNREVGVNLEATGSPVHMKRCLVGNTGPNGGGLGGLGVQASQGASVTLETCVLAGNRDVGLSAMGVGAVVEVDSCTIEGPTPQKVGHFGSGLNMVGGALCTVTDSTIHGALLAGLVASGDGTVLDVVRATVSGTRANPFVGGGYGAIATHGGTLTLGYSVLHDNRQAGLVAAHGGTIVQVDHVAVLETGMDAAGHWGRGIQVQAGASIVANGLVTAGHQEATFACVESQADVRQSILGPTSASLAKGIMLGVADGFLAKGCTFAVDAVVATGNDRAGIFSHDSAGTLTTCLVSGSDFGLVLQGTPLPDVGEGNLLYGNGENVLRDGALQVPDQMMEVPDLPMLQ